MCHFQGRRPRATQVPCPQCQLPTTATTTRGPVTHRKCKGFGDKPGCGHCFQVANGNEDYEDRVEDQGLGTRD